MTPRSGLVVTPRSGARRDAEERTRRDAEERTPTGGRAKVKRSAASLAGTAGALAFLTAAIVEAAQGD